MDTKKKKKSNSAKLAMKPNFSLLIKKIVLEEEKEIAGIGTRFASLRRDYSSDPTLFPT